MIDYDNDPNYEKEEEGVYKDLTTNETVFVFGDEDADMIRKALGVSDEEDQYILTSEDLKRILKSSLDPEEFKGIFESDLNEL